MKSFFTSCLTAFAVMFSLGAFAQCDASVTVAPGSGLLASTAVSQTYQWLDCDNNFAAIPGATSSTYTPPGVGNYAVAVAGTGCVDTSFCEYYANCAGFSANFTANQDSNNLFSLSIDPVINQSLPTNNIQIQYTFGDGGTAYLLPTDTVSHSYANVGTYEICMNTTDSTWGCYYSYCDTITIDSSGMLVNRGTSTAVTVNVNPATFTAVPSAVNRSNKPVAATEMRLFPNPSTGILNIDLIGNTQDDFEILVIDLNGRVLRNEVVNSFNNNTPYTLNLTELPVGMYFIRYLTNNETVTKAFVKQ